jgi:hypothetical protein
MALTAAALTTAALHAQTPLEIYDAAITGDSTAFPPAALLTSPVTLNGTGGSAFDFGATSDDATIEFIVQGNPGANGSAYLAVGANLLSSLRYEVWDNTGELGFTQGGVADYQFTPGVPSPAGVTHIAYVWDPAVQTMRVYVNGSLAGSTTGVSPAFVMPSGAGWLGANERGDEGMVGTIHRVTVYDTALPASTIKLHASAFGAHVTPALTAYDAAITTDVSAGLTPTARQSSTLTLNGTGGLDFDFGANSDDVTFEFILEGNPDFANGAYLAVGEVTDSNLRYEVWGVPNQMGFTLLRVADYALTPPVASPTLPTHIAYAWNAATHTMTVYVNGVLVGANSAVSAAFVMPSGWGRIGSNPSGIEAMMGTIYRVTGYDSLLDDATILRHGKAFADLLSPPTITAFTVTPEAIAAGGTATLNWEVKNATKILVDGVDRTGTTSLPVSALISRTYTLVAQNSLGAVSKVLRLQVNPDLTPYDAAITADANAGLTPLAKLTTQVAATGNWSGVPFDFGPTSGDTTIEFILEGDPTTGSGTAIATDFDPDTGVWRHSLRYSQWDANGLMGVTKRAVADYTFTPPVPASSWPTHVTFVWDSAMTTMSVYVNGSLAGQNAGISSEFAMPTGMGILGEGMVGTIFRVTEYSGMLPEAKIMSHAKAFLANARPKLSAYDDAVVASATGGVTPTARLFAPVTLPGDRGITFSFGSVTGDGTLEFILEGDPGASVSSFLAVGQATLTSRLVFESWADTEQLGFTQAGVADYLFSPGVASPTTPTHVAYAWNDATTTMKIYVNGTLAGTTTGVDPAFVLPSDLGVLGASSAAGGEPMTGTIHRVTVYDNLLQDSVILAHAKAFIGVSDPPVLAIEISGGLPVIALSHGIAGAHYRVETRNSLGAADTWQLLQDIPALAGTSVRVSDPTPASGRSARFYRAVLIQ